METEYWEEQYRSAATPPLHPVLTGFNVNLDRIIPVTKDLLDPPRFCAGSLEEIRSRLANSMQYCTAEEWFIPDPTLYYRLASCFGGTGTIALGGQAGIAAAHLAGLGAPDVMCTAPLMGKKVARILGDNGVRVPKDGSDGHTPLDTVHHIFEYAPGLVPLAQGAVPRNNRFIASPAKTAKNTLLSDQALAALLKELKNGTRAFLSGYQYLETNDEFLRAASQIEAIRQAGPDNRVHIECVSVTDPRINAGIVRHILPVADSAGMNENELTLLLGHPVNAGPEGLAEGILELAEMTGITRIHLHMYGCYLLATKKERADCGASRDSLYYAARIVADAARGDSVTVSPQGVAAVNRLADVLGEGEGPGMWCTGDYFIQAIPTLIASNVRKTTGLGDILSSTAFVSDKF